MPSISLLSSRFVRLSGLRHQAVGDPRGALNEALNEFAIQKVVIVLHSSVTAAPKQSRSLVRDRLVFQ